MGFERVVCFHGSLDAVVRGLSSFCRFGVKIVDFRVSWKESDESRNFRYEERNLKILDILKENF